MALKTGLFGKPERFQDVSLGYRPWQQQNIQQAGQMGMDMLRNPYAGFEPIQQAAQQNFQQQTVPTLMQRLTNMGGGQSGSFGLQAAQAGRGLESDLAAQRAMFGQNNIQNAMGLLDRGNTRMYDTMFRPRQQGIFEQIGGKLLNNLFSTTPEQFGQMWGGQPQSVTGQQGQQNQQSGQQTNPYANMSSFAKLLGMFV